MALGGFLNAQRLSVATQGKRCARRNGTCFRLDEQSHANTNSATMPSPLTIRSIALTPCWWEGIQGVCLDSYKVFHER